MKVLSINHLKELCSDKSNDFFVSLNGGVRSSKSIEFSSDANTFLVFNHIDETHQELSEKELIDDRVTIIGKAIRNGAFYSYNN